MNKLKKNTKYNFRVIGLTMDRTWLYERINNRVVKLMNKGLLEEVQNLKKHGYDERYSSMKAIGYKELFSYLRGECTLEEAIETIKTNTRHYAKRQLTWLKRYGDIHWIEIQKGQSVGNIVDKILAEFPEK